MFIGGLILYATFGYVSGFAQDSKLSSVADPGLAKQLGADERGMFVFAVETEQEAQQLVATDPVIKNGEMIAEYHLLYASAALMAVNEIHEKIAPQ